MEQDHAFELFTQGRNVFITGPGGSGKSTLIKKIVKHLITYDINHSVCAMTGCAAVLLGKASTLHSWSGMRIARGTEEEVFRSILRNKYSINNYKKTKVLIVDEVSMMSKKIFNILYKAIKTLNPRIQVIFTGDFYQLPPVGTPGEPDTEAFCFESEYWSDWFPREQCVVLNTIYRQNDPEYISLLQNIRIGQITPEQSEILQSRVRDNFDDNSETNGVAPPRLYPVKRTVDSYNRLQFITIEEETHTFQYTIKTNARTYVDSGEPIEYEVLERCKNLSKQEIDFEVSALITLNSLSENIELKIGCVVMLTKNINVETGLCNGAQGVIVNFDTANGKPIVRFSNGIVETIPPYGCQSHNYPTIIVSTIPLILSWAVTVHKVQGTTLSNAIMDLGNNVFEYGQAYVALSRVKSIDGLFLERFNPTRIKVNSKVVDFYSRLDPPIENEIAFHTRSPPPSSPSPDSSRIVVKKIESRKQIEIIGKHNDSKCFGNIIKGNYELCSCSSCENWGGCSSPENKQYYLCEKCGHSYYEIVKLKKNYKGK
jgi:ATP-dependent DNA helicase PIF1